MYARRLLQQPGFGTGPVTVGAEAELFLVDSSARPLPRNQPARTGPVADHGRDLRVHGLNTGPLRRDAGSKVLMVAGAAKDIKDGVALAARALDGGAARAKLQALIAASNR